jgi:hypothetical protein
LASKKKTKKKAKTKKKMRRKKAVSTKEIVPPDQEKDERTDEEIEAEKDTKNQVAALTETTAADMTLRTVTEWLNDNTVLTDEVQMALGQVVQSGQARMKVFLSALSAVQARRLQVLVAKQELVENRLLEPERVLGMDNKELLSTAKIVGDRVKDTAGALRTYVDGPAPGLVVLQALQEGREDESTLQDATGIAPGKRETIRQAFAKLTRKK